MVAITSESNFNGVRSPDHGSVATTSPLPKNAASIGIESRRERQRQEARRAILDSTQGLLSESEGGDFSIRSLAARCGYSAPTIYHYFGDKDGLLAALLNDGMRALASELDESCQSRDSLERLRSILLTFIRFATDHPTFSSLWGTVARQPGTEMPEAYEKVKELLDAPVRELIAAGSFNEFDTASAEQVLWAMLHGLITLQMAEPDHPWAPGLAENAVDSLLRGMTSRSAGTIR